MRVIKAVLGPVFPSGATHMDAYPSASADLTYSDEHPILLAASSEAAMACAERTLLYSGLRIGAKLPMEGALERLGLQGKAGAVWIEIDRDCGAAMDDVLSRVAEDVSAGRYGAVVSVVGTTKEALAALLDPISALLEDCAVELIANADDVDRIAALAAVRAQSEIPAKLAEAAADRSAERLRQLSEEVSRIASSLARLSMGPSDARQSREPVPTGEIPALSADSVLKIIRARRTRARYFSEELFADPAWDMLLDLLQAEIRQLRVPVSSLCIAAAVPATTALRWLKMLVSKGIFIRRADPHDGRRVFVELAPDTSLAMRRYFGEVGAIVAI